MTEIKNEQIAKRFYEKRYKEFYYENQEAKNYVNDLLNQGYSTPDALRQMRKYFAKEYYKWKMEKGYKKSWTDFCCGSFQEWKQ